MTCAGVLFGWCVLLVSGYQACAMEAVLDGGAVVRFGPDVHVLFGDQTLGEFVASRGGQPTGDIAIVTCEPSTGLGRVLIDARALQEDLGASAFSDPEKIYPKLRQLKTVTGLFVCHIISPDGRTSPLHRANHLWAERFKRARSYSAEEEAAGIGDSSLLRYISEHAVSLK